MTCITSTITLSSRDVQLLANGQCDIGCGCGGCSAESPCSVWLPMALPLPDYAETANGNGNGAAVTLTMRQIDRALTGLEASLDRIAGRKHRTRHREDILKLHSRVLYLFKD